MDSTSIWRLNSTVWPPTVSIDTIQPRSNSTVQPPFDTAGDRLGWPLISTFFYFLGWATKCTQSTGVAKARIHVPTIQLKAETWKTKTWLTSKKWKVCHYVIASLRHHNLGIETNKKVISVEILRCEEKTKKKLKKLFSWFGNMGM